LRFAQPHTFVGIRISPRLWLDERVGLDRPAAYQLVERDAASFAECETKLEELYQELMADLAQKETNRAISWIFVKLKFNDFSRTTVDRAGLDPSLAAYRLLLTEGFSRAEKSVRLIGVGVRFAEFEQEPAQLALF
jgi:DNA polymerase-4